MGRKGDMVKGENLEERGMGKEEGELEGMEAMTAASLFVREEEEEKETSE